MPPSRFTRRRDSRSSPALTAEDRPLLAPGVAFEEGADQTLWIAMLHGVPSSRVSRSVVDLLTAMNGETSLRDLHRDFAASETLESFLELARRFQLRGLLAGDSRRPPGRITYRPPFTLQVATLRAPVVFGRLDALLRPLSPRAVLVSMGALVVAGALAAAVQVSELREAVTTPMPLVDVVAVVAALFLITLLHEGAHGAALTRFGGRARRAGFMLLYLAPAFFVDVTDGWRLPDRRQRVAIALAGPAVHAALGAIALSAALLVPSQELRRTLLVLGLACAIVVVVNLIPFVRFDGYIALMSALDEPNLRRRTMRDAADLLTRLLFGGHRGNKSMNTWWSVPFGLASLVAPIVLVLFAVVRVNRALAGGGPLLGMLVVALEVVVVLAGVVHVSKSLHRVLRSGVSRLRFVAVGAAAIVGVAIAGAAISVPMSTTFGFTTSGDRVVLVHAGDMSDVTVPEGARVSLMSNGILFNEQLGEGTAHPLPPAKTTVPLDALFPITADYASVPAAVVAEVQVSAAHGRLPVTGQARVENGTGNLWQMLWATGVVSPLSTFQGQEEEESP
ncbi:M50 family metallopeptidase [Microbacterium sp. SSW1-49]|uniref:M50 family metallopeptidase n=1 Tax=Microbacterium croceum TaxID=2851645 RepID=A0ABT0FHV8_9MICO|nr:daptide biosynthesis intramembrane metalloprotease [Microbacterium croceum]MCK2037635.1 M50 family metallopeptidase [Microbacterium croceum]